MGVLIITEIEIIPYQLPPLLPQHSQGEHGKTSGERALLIAEIGVLLILPHGKPGVPFHQGVEAGVLHGTGKELVYSLFGQTCDGKIPLFRSFELHRIAAGKILLLQNLTQVVQHFVAAFLCVVPGSNTDHSKGIVGRCGEVLCFPLLQRERQPAGPVFPELFHHIRTDFLHQSKEVIGVQILKVQAIHFIAHRHIAGETQQRLRDLLCTDTWFQGILPIPEAIIFIACYNKILLL